MYVLQLNIGSRFAPAPLLVSSSFLAYDRLRVDVTQLMSKKQRIISTVEEDTHVSAVFLHRYILVKKIKNAKED
jgi:hypothetical protein